MGFIDRIKKFIYSDNNEYDEEMEEGYGEEEESASLGTASSSSSSSDYGSSYGSGSSYSGSSYSSSRSSYTPRTGRVVNIQTSAQLQVMLVQPERFDDCKAIADKLNEKITVVLNLEGRAPDLSRRVLDFLSGVTYANAGSIKQVAKNTYMLTPSNVELRGDLMDELQNRGLM